MTKPLLILHTQPHPLLLLRCRSIDLDQFAAGNINLVGFGPGTWGHGDGEANKEPRRGGLSVGAPQRRGRTAGNHPRLLPSR